MSDLFYSPKLWIALYAAVALFTFGHAGNKYFAIANAKYAACEAAIPDRWCFRSDGEAGAVFLTALATVAWPFYWSFEVQDA